MSANFGLQRLSLKGRSLFIACWDSTPQAMLLQGVSAKNRFTAPPVLRRRPPQDRQSPNSTPGSVGAGSSFSVGSSSGAGSMLGSGGAGLRVVALGLDFCCGLNRLFAFRRMGDFVFRGALGQITCVGGFSEMRRVGPTASRIGTLDESGSPPRIAASAPATATPATPAMSRRKAGAESLRLGACLRGRLCRPSSVTVSAAHGSSTFTAASFD
jgi:hypothetical protein